MSDDDKARDLFEEVERRAFMELTEEEPEEDVNIVASFAPPGTVEAEEAKDLTLGGYIELHNRPPAFTGVDDQPYTVDIDVEPTGDDDKAYAAFLVFLRWAATGAGIMEHTESSDVAFGDSPENARARALELSLYEVKAELDAAIERKRIDLED